MANVKETGESGCFSSVLRHLLCCHGHGTSTQLGSDPTAHIDRCPEGEAKLWGGKDELGATSSSRRRAGLVARLMGLETLPDAKWVPGSKSQDMFSRSRSANFMDYLLEVDILSRQAQHHPHCRVRTSVSFREVPVTVPTLGPESKENNLIVVILEKSDEQERKEIKMQGKSRKDEIQRRRKKKSSDCGRSEEKKVSKMVREEPRTGSWASCNSESCRPNKVRAAYKKKFGRTYCDTGRQACGLISVATCDDRLKHFPREGRNVESTAAQTSRLLDPIIVHKKKAAMKKNEEVIKFSESGKQMEDMVKKGHELAGAEAGKWHQFSPGSSDREEIYAMMIQEHILDCLLEEFVVCVV